MTVINMGIVRIRKPPLTSQYGDSPPIAVHLLPKQCISKTLGNQRPLPSLRLEVVVVFVM